MLEGAAQALEEQEGEGDDDDTQRRGPGEEGEAMLDLPGPDGEGANQVDDGDQVPNGGNTAPQRHR